MTAGMPRILAIMGSGETAPTMTSVHADLLNRLGPPPVPAVMLDTPYGFQENAPEISAKAMQYFRENVRHPIEIASFRRAEATDALAYETMLAQVRQARYVFAGPGSPTYAVSQWRQSAVRQALVEKLETGGCVTFSSAAACTLGRVGLPVYEVYKVGMDPFWFEGLDLVATIGINAAVIPHYNNAEGGTHDTRFCYMGERRLRILEAQLRADEFVLGVDEHTALILDLVAGSATVRGNGAISLRRAGREQRIPAGETVPIDLIRSGGDGGGAPAEVMAPPVEVAGEAAAAPAESPRSVERARNPFMDGVDQRRADFDSALDVGDVDAALAALLSLDGHLWDWSRDTLDSDDMDRARSLMRTMLVRLGGLAHTGMRDPREVVGPFVEAILELRVRARAEHRFDQADALRDVLAGLGVEVRDGRDGSSWELA